MSPTVSSAPIVPDETLFSDIASFVRAPRVTGLASSRSGRVIATRRTIDEGGTAFIDQLFDITPRSARQRTFGDKSASLLAVGERGEIYFTRSDPGAEKKGDAIWMLPPEGEARVIFRHRGGIEGLQASRTNLYVSLSVLPGALDDGVCAAQQVAASSELAKKREDAQVTAVLHQRYPTRYWADDLGPGEVRLYVSPLPSLDRPTDFGSPAERSDDLTAAESSSSDGPRKAQAPVLLDSELDLTEVNLPAAPEGAHQWSLSDVLVAGEGRWALICMQQRTSIDTSAQVWLVSPGGEPRLVMADANADVCPAAIAADEKWVVLGRELPPLPGQTVQETTLRVDLETGAAVPIWDQQWNDLALSPAGDVYVTCDRRGRGGIYRLDGHGGADLLTPDDEYTYASLCWAEGGLVALRSSVAEPASVVFVDPTSRSVTQGPSLTPDLSLPGVLTEVDATAVDGTPLRAWLVLPEGDGPHPLVVFAHGGPWGSWNDWTWRWNPWVFAARGYAVLLPDPGISTGYGSEMLARGHDSIGDEPFTDIMALADVVIARDDIDEERQLFAGGSYGGYMANWVAGHSGNRFKGIVTHASLWNIESVARTTDNGSWYRWMMGPVPSASHGGASQADSWSPHRAVEQIEVPMLVIHGDKDYRVPIGQGQELWMDLQRTSPHLDHRYLYFPDEGHWILKPANAQVWYQAFLAFLDQHAQGEGQFVTPELLG